MDSTNPGMAHRKQHMNLFCCKSIDIHIHIHTCVCIYICVFSMTHGSQHQPTTTSVCHVDPRALSQSFCSSTMARGDSRSGRILKAWRRSGEPQFMASFTRKMMINQGFGHHHWSSLIVHWMTEALVDHWGFI